MSRKRSRGGGGLTPQGAVSTFLPISVGLGFAGPAIGLSAAGGAAATAAGAPAAGSLMNVASMGVATQAIGLTMGKKKRRL